ncbi:MAG: DUF2087 domain-containing protein [Candidatus Eremiobacteraeota bacterium]|nr:DUF2087 domain-containing protein [Candidatus Eremiobacteraeota bacterium]
MNQPAELFFRASMEEMMKGHVFDSSHGEYRCLFCGMAWEQGTIYQEGPSLHDAEKAVSLHITAAHGSPFEYILSMNRRHTGLTDHARTMLQLFHEGLSDSEIVRRLGGGSTSTVRNHRFLLREREKQATVFLALMGLLEKKASRRERLIHPHPTATMVDDRYVITEKERDEILKAYFREGTEGTLLRFPRKEKRKLVVLTAIANRFERKRNYSEKEVNELLKSVYDDYVTVRRYLIEYGFLDREKDGSRYWVKY